MTGSSRIALLSAVLFLAMLGGAHGAEIGVPASPVVGACAEARAGMKAGAPAEGKDGSQFVRCAKERAISASEAPAGTAPSAPDAVRAGGPGSGDVAAARQATALADPSPATAARGVRAAPATQPPAAEQPLAAAEAPKRELTAGRRAAIVRVKACGAAWQAEKKAGRLPAGAKWPRYWSECNKRLKAEEG